MVTSFFEVYNTTIFTYVKQNIKSQHKPKGIRRPSTANPEAELQETWQSPALTNNQVEARQGINRLQWLCQVVRILVDTDTQTEINHVYPG